MGDGVTVVALVLVTLATSLVTCTLATSYVVGAGTCSYGWHYTCDYTAWALSYNFLQGDVLEFDFIESYNTVAQVTATYYWACTQLTTNADPPRYYNSPLTMPLTSAGDYYFVSVVNGACYQKLAVTVTAASNTTPTTTAVPSPPPPSQPLSGPPPASTGTLKIKLVVGASTGGVILLVANIIWFYCRRRHQNQNQLVVKPQVNVDFGFGN